MQTHDTGEDVGQQFAGRDGSIATHRMKADAEGIRWQQTGVLAGLQRHKLGLRIGTLQPLLPFGIFWRRIFFKEL